MGRAVVKYQLPSNAAPVPTNPIAVPLNRGLVVNRGLVESHSERPLTGVFASAKLKPMANIPRPIAPGNIHPPEAKQ
jgi:hypothetical protein